MSKLRALKSIFLGLLLAALCAGPAFAKTYSFLDGIPVDTSRKGAVNAAVKDYEGNPIDYGNATLVKVASLAKAEDLILVYASGFTGLGEAATEEDLASAESFREKVYNAYQESAALGVPMETISLPLDADGRVNFGSVELGMYMLVHTEVPEGKPAFVPAIATVPYAADSEARYDLSIMPKPASPSYDIQFEPEIYKRIKGTGKKPENDHFTFRLEPLTEDAPMPFVSNPDGSAEITIKGSGWVHFGEMTFGAGDVGKTYRYRISEAEGSGKWTYDHSTYTLSIRISSAGSEGGIALAATYVRSDNKAFQGAVFTNEYDGGDNPQNPDNPDNPDEPDNPDWPGDDYFEEIEDEDIPLGEYYEGLPWTGQHWMPALVMILLALVLGFIGLRTKKDKAKGACIALAAVLLLASAGLAGYNMWDSSRAGREASKIMNGLSEAAPVTTMENVPDELLPMAAVSILGTGYIGSVEIPSLELALPVAENWSYAKLKSSPCRYTGSYKTDDLVICGHNYADHFGPIRGIAAGELVTLHTASGDSLNYIVSNIENVDPEDVARMTDAKDWDLTLFTCTAGSQYRVAVRCERVD